MLEEIQQAKQYWLNRVIPVLTNADKISAETLGYIGETIASFERNEIAVNKKPLDYDRVVKDVKEVMEILPQSDRKDMI